MITSLLVMMIVLVCVFSVSRETVVAEEKRYDQNAQIQKVHLIKIQH